LGIACVVRPARALIGAEINQCYTFGAVKFLSLIAAVCVSSGASLCAQGSPIAPPPAGKLYHGFYWGGVGTDTHDPTEHDVIPADVRRYEQAVGKKTAWVYFSDNWFESRKFPAEMCGWIRSLGKLPFIRLMLRSDVDQKHAERTFSLSNIVAGDFDEDLREWARAARDFRTPLLIEWGTEPNGRWFSWNGAWNGGARQGSERYIAAYRHIVDLMHAEGADNLQWVWHVNWDDDPETKWNRFENYFPGKNYCDWLALSIYGPTTPTARDGTGSFATKMREAYPRLRKLAPEKSIIIAEFGCDMHNPRIDAARWAASALEQLFSGQWLAVIGFCWWNEGWQNDDQKKHDSDLIILHDPDLTRVFHDQFERHADKIQERPVVRTDTGRLPEPPRGD
jgi:Glycosyl hydrolase family 26